MKFSKIVSTITLGAFLAMAPMAFATDKRDCNGPDCLGMGGLDVSAFAIGGGLDADLQFIPFGVAGGVSAAGGVGGAEADGFIFNGDLEGSAWATGGGLASTEANRFFSPVGDLGIGVGSSSRTEAQIGAGAAVEVDPGFFGGGAAYGRFGAIGGQASLDASGLTTNPWLMESKGVTGGVAAQGSIGYVAGDVFAASGSDYLSWERCGCWCGYLKYNDSYAGAAAGGEILMGGYSDSQSVRFIDFDGNYVTEGLGTYVRAGSNVESYGYQYDYDRGLGYADADLSGGYIVAGGAAARTIQTTNTGMATAQATGAYVGKGELNCNFRGSVEGQTFTTVTRAAGMNGTISHSEAAMSVTARNIQNNNIPN